MCTGSMMVPLLVQTFLTGLSPIQLPSFTTAPSMGNIVGVKMFSPWFFHRGQTAFQPAIIFYGFLFLIFYRLVQLFDGLFLCFYGLLQILKDQNCSTCK